MCCVVCAIAIEHDMNKFNIDFSDLRYMNEFFVLNCKSRMLIITDSNNNNSNTFC